MPSEAKRALVDYVDTTTGEHSLAQIRLADTVFSLKPFAVAVIQLN